MDQLFVQSGLDSPDVTEPRPRNLTVKDVVKPIISVGSAGLPKAVTIDTHPHTTKQVKMQSLKEANMQMLKLSEANAWAAHKTEVLASSRISERRPSARIAGTPKAQVPSQRSSHVSNLLGTFRGKENLTLKPFLRTYDNVDENTKAKR